jgi:outer membrane lipoprotein carrier protein
LRVSASIGGFILALALVLWPMHGGRAGGTPPLEQLVARVQARYDQTTHFHARFHQETRVRGFDQPQTGEGQVWILKPGMMRWEYTKPDPQTIIVQGETLWMYFPAERQVIRDRLSDSLQSRAPALFLAGRGKLTELFSVAGPGPDPAGKEGLLTLQLTPRAEPAHLSEVRLGIDPGSYLIVRVTLIDALGSVTTIRFSDINTEVAIDPSLFQFQVPPGVEVVSPPLSPGAK